MARRADPVATLTRWREFQQAIASMRCELASAEAAIARRRRQQALDGETALRAERARLLGAGGLDLARLQLVERTEAGAAELERTRRAELAAAETAERAAQEARLRARAELKVSENRRSRMQREQARVEEHRTFDTIVETHLQNRERRRD